MKQVARPINEQASSRPQAVDEIRMENPRDSIYLLFAKRYIPVPLHPVA